MNRASIRGEPGIHKSVPPGEIRTSGGHVSHISSTPRQVLAQQVLGLDLMGCYVAFPECTENALELSGSDLAQSAQVTFAKGLSWLMNHLIPEIGHVAQHVAPIVDMKL